MLIHSILTLKFKIFTSLTTTGRMGLSPLPPFYDLNRCTASTKPNVNFRLTLARIIHALNHSVVAAEPGINFGSTSVMILLSLGGGSAALYTINRSVTVVERVVKFSDDLLCHTKRRRHTQQLSQRARQRKSRQERWKNRAGKEKENKRKREGEEEILIKEKRDGEERYCEREKGRASCPSIDGCRS